MTRTPRTSPGQVPVCPGQPGHTSIEVSGVRLSCPGVLVPCSLADSDDRRPCLACLNLTESRRCMAAARGALPGAAWDYRPVDWPPRRCPEFFPHPNDPDQRHGRERWPWLMTPSVEVTP